MRSKSTPRQFEMDLGREAFALVAQTGTDHDRAQALAVQQERDRAQASKAQWWFDQMRLTVNRANGD